MKGGKERACVMLNRFSSAVQSLRNAKILPIMSCSNDSVLDSKFYFITEYISSKQHIYNTNENKMH